jgi:hypothetical protein
MTVTGCRDTLGEVEGACREVAYLNEAMQPTRCAGR